MIKLVLADDEPLVLIGLKSMIDWEALGIEICGAASNGDAAWEMIREQRPEIVITDIRMPCFSGLELAARCREELGRIPVFIILTSYEDFQYAKEAMKFQVLDYLVKIDLSPEMLTESVKKAMEQVKLLKQQEMQEVAVRPHLPMFQERFYICLLNNLFESREQILQQAEDLQISFEEAGYVVANMEFDSHTQPVVTAEENLRSYNRALQMFKELIVRYIPCQVVALDTQFLAAIFRVDKEHLADWKSYVQSALTRTFDMLHKYYNVSFYTSIGRLVTEPMELSVSYYDARQVMGFVSAGKPVIFWDDCPDTGSLRNVFNLYLFRNEITRAFEEQDERELHKIIKNILELLSVEQIHFSQAMDVASSILHISINLLTDGEKIVSHIFAKEPDTYRCLYRMKNVKAVIWWLETLEQGLVGAFEQSRKEKKHYLVAGCCQYIRDHVHERIALQELAEAFEVSPNYLSQIFKKNMDMGISEYVTMQKINESKHLLKETNMKIYEISDSLGFESAFYFSKVFKKMTGIAPKDFRNQG